MDVDSLGQPLPSPAPDDSRVLGVFLGPDLVVDYYGGDLRLTLLQVFEDGLVLSWHFGPVASVHADEPDERDHRNFRFPPPEFTISDSASTRYRKTAHQISAGRYHMHGRYQYRPSTPQQGTQLLVSLGMHQFGFDIAPNQIESPPEA
jgi:hypothetical protein